MPATGHKRQPAAPGRTFRFEPPNADSGDITTRTGKALNVMADNQNWRLLMLYLLNMEYTINIADSLHAEVLNEGFPQ